MLVTIVSISENLFLEVANISLLLDLNVKVIAIDSFTVVDNEVVLEVVGQATKKAEVAC